MDAERQTGRVIHFIAHFLVTNFFTQSLRCSRPNHYLILLLVGLCWGHSGTVESQIFRQRFAQPDSSHQPVAAVANRGGQPTLHRVETKHFLVMAPDAVLARQVAREAERFRHELAIDWLGYELPDWLDKCPIVVELGMHAGGETSFEFVFEDDFRGTPRNWQMKIFGPVDRLLDSVLPHEITHTVFATHFGRPLPRWADEGACTTVEHESERAKNHQMLLDFLQSNRGIPFNRMFEMRQYPHDILPLYAQGYSLSKFLIRQSGKREFLNFVEAGMRAEQSMPVLKAWDRTVDQHYGYQDLSELQIAWINWVRSGSQEIPAASLASRQRESGSSVELASADLTTQDQASPIAQVGYTRSPAPQRPDSKSANDRSNENPNHQAVSANVKSGADTRGSGWYARQSRGERVLLNRTEISSPPHNQSQQSDTDDDSQPNQRIRSLLDEDDTTPIQAGDNIQLRDFTKERTIWR